MRYSSNICGKGSSVKVNTGNYLLLLKTRTQGLTLILLPFSKMFPRNTKIYDSTNLTFSNCDNQDSWAAMNILFDISISFLLLGIDEE